MGLVVRVDRTGRVVPSLQHERARALRTEWRTLGGKGGHRIKSDVCSLHNAQQAAEHFHDCGAVARLRFRLDGIGTRCLSKYF